MRIPGLGDRSTPHACSARVLPGHHAHVAHQLARRPETAEIAEFAHQRRRDYRADAAQSLQGAVQLAVLVTQQVRQALDLLRQYLDALVEVLDLAQVLLLGEFLRLGAEPQAVDPLEILGTPGGLAGPALTVTQEQAA